MKVEKKLASEVIRQALVSDIPGMTGTDGGDVLMELCKGGQA